MADGRGNPGLVAPEVLEVAEDFLRVTPVLTVHCIADLQLHLGSPEFEEATRDELVLGHLRPYGGPDGNPRTGVGGLPSSRSSSAR